MAYLPEMNGSDRKVDIILLIGIKKKKENSSTRIVAYNFVVKNTSMDTIIFGRKESAMGN